MRDILKYLGVAMVAFGFLVTLFALGLFLEAVYGESGNFGSATVVFVSAGSMMLAGGSVYLLASIDERLQRLELVPKASDQQAGKK
jgi:hypothetical protein